MEFLNYWNKLLYYLDPVLWLGRLWDLLQDVFFSILQFLIDTLADFIEFVGGMADFALPVISVPSAPQIYIDIAGYVNWLIPFSFMSTCLVVMVSSTVFYFTLGIILRWAKIVD